MEEIQDQVEKMEDTIEKIQNYQSEFNQQIKEIKDQN